MKFSIRDLILVTVIVGLAVGWWVDHYSLQNAAKRAKEDAEWLIYFTAGADVAARYLPKLEELRERYDSDLVDEK